jgi:hypothetical protein
MSPCEPDLAAVWMDVASRGDFSMGFTTSPGLSSVQTSDFVRSVVHSCPEWPYPYPYPYSYAPTTVRSTPFSTTPRIRPRPSVSIAD